MYIFPRIKLPAAAVAEAKARGLAPDLFYAMELLDATGVVVVPVCARALLNVYLMLALFLNPVTARVVALPPRPPSV